MEPVTDNIFTVESIIAERYRQDKTEYLIQWKDWNSRHNSWEPIENILDARPLLEFFERNRRLEELQGKTLPSYAAKNEISNPLSSDKKDEQRGSSVVTSVPGGLKISSVTKQIVRKPNREDKLNRLSIEQLQQFSEKERELDLAFHNDSETFGIAVKMMIDKDPASKDRLLSIMSKVIQDLKEKMAQELDEFVDSLLREM